MPRPKPRGFRADENLVVENHGNLYIIPARQWEHWMYVRSKLEIPAYAYKLKIGDKVLFTTWRIA